MAPYSSAENGLAERAIRTTIQDTHALLRDLGLAHKYWAEAAAVSVYIRNLIPSCHHPNTIPAESWTSKRQDVSHLRAFGSTCWAKIPTVNGQQVSGGSKLDDRSIRAKLLGYTSGGHYKLLDENGKIFISHDVIFEEGMLPHTLSVVGETEQPNGDLFLDPEVPKEPFTSPDTLTPTTTDTNADDIAPDAPETQEPNQASQPPTLRRSTRIVASTHAAAESREYQQSEDNARSMGEDWATNSIHP